jgi:hypothetical protein
VSWEVLVDLPGKTRGWGSGEGVFADASNANMATKNGKCRELSGRLAKESSFLKADLANLAGQRAEGPN